MSLRAAAILSLTLAAAPVLAQTAAVETAKLGKSQVTLIAHPFLTPEELQTLRLVMTNKQALSVFLPGKPDSYSALAASPSEGFIRGGKPVASATAETASAAADFATAAARDAGSVGAHAEAARQWRAAVQMLELAASRQLAPSVAMLDQDIEVRCGLIAALAQSGDAVTARSEMKCALQLVSGRSRDDLVVRILTAWDTPLVWRDREYDESDGQMIGLLRHVLAGDVSAADRIRLLKALGGPLDSPTP